MGGGITADGRKDGVNRIAPDWYALCVCVCTLSRGSAMAKKGLARVPLNQCQNHPLPCSRGKGRGEGVCDAPGIRPLTRPAADLSPGGERVLKLALDLRVLTAIIAWTCAPKQAMPIDRA